MTFEEGNLKEWETAIKSIFDGKPSHSTEWDENTAIIGILDKLGSVKQLSHMFYPSGGEIVFKGAKPSVENGCIELLSGGVDADIVKPQKLSFHFFGDDNYEWAYFRLETGNLEPSGVYEDYTSDFYQVCQNEELTEISPGKYVERKYAYYGYYESDENGERPLPKGARVVARYFKGAFVFFATTSTYSRTPATSDARHNKMTSEEFERHIQGAINYLAKEK